MFESDIYATVYPHGIKPYGIIPDIYVENFLTLNPMQKRYVWSIYIHINDQNQIINVELIPEIIENKKSFTYDEAEHILQSYAESTSTESTSNKPYTKYLAIIAEFCESYGRNNFPTIYATYENHLTNSHYLITILMSYANQYVGNYLSTDPLAIYRTTSETISGPISEKKFNEESIHISSYSMNKPNDNIHKVMNLQNYTHYTSPIRRFVDQYIHLRLYKKMFGVDLMNIKLSEKVMNIINRSLTEMKMMGNLNFSANVLINSIN
jgi:exoribonuclease R